MEIKEYPAVSGAPSSTLPSYSDGVAECDPTSGFLENWKRLDTEFLIALFDTGNSKRLLEQVQKEDFCNSCCGSLFECMQQVASTGPLTSMRVLDALTSTRWTGDVYWRGEFLNLVAPGRDREDATICASLLVQLSWRDRVRRLGMELQQAAETLSVEELDELLFSSRMDEIKAHRGRLATLEAMAGGAV